jgi:hypothetical protein
MLAGIPSIEELATRYRCHRRTVERMRNDGVDIYDPQAVFLHIAGQHTRSVPMLERLASILDELPDDPISH